MSTFFRKEYRPPTAKVIPHVNLNRCEADGNCTHVCTQKVFKIGQITIEQYRQLTFIGKVKTLLNDNRKCFVVAPDNCLNCGRCVEACPNSAISLVTVDEKRS